MRLMALTKAITGEPVLVNPTEVVDIYEYRAYKNLNESLTREEYELCRRIRLKNNDGVSVREQIEELAHEWECCMKTENKDTNDQLVKRIIERAEKNMVPSEVKDVKRILASIKLQKRYSDVTEEELQDFLLHYI